MRNTIINFDQPTHDDIECWTRDWEDDLYQRARKRLNVNEKKQKRFKKPKRRD